MTAQEHKICSAAIREMRILCNYHRLIGLRDVGQRFPAAFCEVLEELLNRFEARLESEPISLEVSSDASSGDSFKASVTNNDKR